MGDFQDFYLQTRKKQSDLAAKCAEEIIRDIPGEIKNLVQADGMKLMRLNVQQMALKFIRDYAAWLAGRIMRSGNFAKQAVPVYRKEELRALCGRDCNYYSFACAFVKRLIQPGVEIPAVGKVYLDGEIIPDREGLEEWVSFLKKTKAIQP